MTDRTKWFREARYGMFIHWGVYSVLGRGEWVRNRERIPEDEYRKLTRRFTADKFDADALARLAKECGIKYLVLTTKHHDGFCLFDTATTSFNSINSAAGRDLVKEYVTACRRHGLKIGLYFSLMDWSHPLCLPDSRMYHWDGGQMVQFGTNPPFKSKPEFIAYLRQQMTELLTNYGKIDILWHDGTWAYDAEGWHIKELNEYARRIQPHIIFTDRAHRKEDIASFEQHIPYNVEVGASEACMTLNENWGYAKGDNNWKTPKQVLGLLLTVAKNNGCLLLNMGPRADGTLPAKGIQILREVGRWTQTYGESIYGDLTRSPFSWSNVFYETIKGTSLYLHVRLWNSTLVFPGLNNEVRSVILLPEKERVRFQQEKDRLILFDLPRRAPDSLMTVIKVVWKGASLEVV